MGGRGGGAGRAGGAGPAGAARGLAAAARIAARGLVDSELKYLRTGMRELATFRKAFADAKRNGISATTVASTGRYPGGRFPPITIAIDADGTTHLRDGRHRYTAAREAGAKKILAKVIVYGPRGGIVREEQRVLKIARR